jgi:FKBP-type peptidyl-prolyl cis-trans isomerase
MARAATACLLMGVVTILGGCMDSIAGAQCTRTTFTVAEMRGDTTVTSTGLRWIQGVPGSGTPADWCQLIAVEYEAFLLDGTRFDSSAENGSPLVFTPGLGALIDGLEQGVIGMRTGGRRRLVIPPALGFGQQPRRNAAGDVIVPANSTVVYDIELLQIAP